MVLDSDKGPYFVPPPPVITLSLSADLVLLSTTTRHGLSKRSTLFPHYRCVCVLMLMTRPFERSRSRWRRGGHRRYKYQKMHPSTGAGRIRDMGRRKKKRPGRERKKRGDKIVNWRMGEAVKR